MRSKADGNTIRPWQGISPTQTRSLSVIQSARYCLDQVTVAVRRKWDRTIVWSVLGSNYWQ